MTPRVAGDQLGKSYLTVIRWCKNGIIKACQKKKGKRLVWDIPQSEIQRLWKELPLQEEESQLENSGESNSTECRVDQPDYLPVGDPDIMNRLEAERRIKIEEYKKRLRENQIKDKELVERNKVNELIRVQYEKLLGSIMEVIDEWSIRDRWTDEIYRDKIATMKIALSRYERKLKHAIEDA